MDVEAAFIANGEPAELIQPRQRTFHHPPMPAQPLAGLNAPTGDAALDAPLSEVNAAKTVVVRFIGVEFVRPTAWPPVPAANGRDGVHQRGQNRAVLPMGTRNFDGQRDALAIDHHMALGACFAPILSGWGPWLARRVWPARCRCPGRPGSNRGDRVGRANRAVRDGCAAKRLGPATPAAGASKSCPSRNPVLSGAVPRGCRCGAQRVCRSGLGGGAPEVARRAVEAARAAATVPAPPTEPHPEGVLPSRNMPAPQGGFRGFVRHSKSPGTVDTPSFTEASAFATLKFPSNR